MHRFAFLAAAALIFASPAAAQTTLRTDRFDPQTFSPFADTALGAVGVVLLVVVLVLSILPIFAIDWQRSPLIGWCIVLLMAFGSIAAFGGPPVARELTLVVMWGLATIAAALTRIGGTMSRMLAIQASVTTHNPETGKPLTASPIPAPAPAPPLPNPRARSY